MNRYVFVILCSVRNPDLSLNINSKRRFLNFIQNLYDQFDNLILNLKKYNALCDRSF